MNKKRFLFTFVMALMVTMTAFAQKRTFTGTVVDSNGAPPTAALPTSTVTTQFRWTPVPPSCSLT